MSLAAAGAAQEGDVQSLAWTGVGILFLTNLLTLSRWFMLYRLKSMPGFGETAMLAIDEDGMHADTPEGVSRIKWSAFSSAYRVPNGLLLYRGRIYFNWLPDQAIQGNQDPREATKLVEKNATKYHDCS